MCVDNKKLCFFGILFMVLIILPNCESARATELIFRKTTTVEPDEIENNDQELNATSTKDAKEDIEAVKTKLTGIPQIDYIYDPNLPRELNGYNLSTYPFLDSVPVEDEIDFACDGLHDGFYASVKFNCQLYHHCLYGIRYDFLCANFTSFDQKTFICHFASEVDCKNSPRYYYRNDALYKHSTTEIPSTTTTTTSSTTTTTETIQTNVKVPETSSVQQNRPFGRPHRRRPSFVEDYYDDYYYDEVEPPLRYRRPIIRDEFNDYESPRYRPRKVHNSRRNLYNIDRRPVSYDNEDKTGNKQAYQNNGNSKVRRLQQHSSKKVNEPSNRPTTNIRSKYNKYLPKPNVEVYAPSLTEISTKDKKIDRLRKTNTQTATDDEYSDLTYEDDDYVEYDDAPMLKKNVDSTKMTKPILSIIRERGYNTRNIHRSK